MHSVTSACAVAPPEHQPIVLRGAKKGGRRNGSVPSSDHPVERDLPCGTSALEFRHLALSALQATSLTLLRRRLDPPPDVLRPDQWWKGERTEAGKVTPRPLECERPGCAVGVDPSVCGRVCDGEVAPARLAGHHDRELLDRESCALCAAERTGGAGQRHEDGSLHRSFRGHRLGAPPAQLPTLVHGPRPRHRRTPERPAPSSLRRRF